MDWCLHYAGPHPNNLKQEAAMTVTSTPPAQNRPKQSFVRWIACVLVVAFGLLCFLLLDPAHEEASVVVPPGSKPAVTDNNVSGMPQPAKSPSL